MGNIQHEAILGAAGTGKTTLINERIKENPNYCYRTASTGAAALVLANMGIKGLGGRTIHSALGFHNTISLAKAIQKGYIYDRLEKISSLTNILLIDEIPMMNACDFDLIVYAISQFNKQGTNYPIKLLVIGDFGQLPPVAKGAKAKPVFLSKNWPEFTVTFLKKIKRQSNKEFIRVLNNLRADKAEEVVDWVEDNIGFNEKINVDFNGCTVFPNNSDVDSYNQYQLNKIARPSKFYDIQVKGNPPSLKRQISDRLELKEGCQVMILVNNLREGYANGSIGIVKRLKNKSVDVELVNTGETVNIKPHTLFNIPLNSSKSIGNVTYMPLRLAYATTIHATQGITITGGLQCKLGGNFLPRLSGGLYVMLSRCTDYKNIRLIGNKEEFIRSNYIDEVYKNWINRY